MMLPVFPSSIFFNRISQAQSAAEGGRSSGGFFFGFDPKATACKARGAAIARVPATSVSPENPVMRLLEVIAIYAATARLLQLSAARGGCITRGVPLIPTTKSV
jgi:hypothetical protein